MFLFGLLSCLRAMCLDYFYFNSSVLLTMSKTYLAYCPGYFFLCLLVMSRKYISILLPAVWIFLSNCLWLRAMLQLNNLSVKKSALIGKKIVQYFCFQVERHVTYLFFSRIHPLKIYGIYPWCCFHMLFLALGSHKFCISIISVCCTRCPFLMKMNEHKPIAIEPIAQKSKVKSKRRNFYFMEQ